LRASNIPSPRDVLITHVQEENISGASNFRDARLHVPASDEYLCEGPTAYAKVVEKWQDPWEWETRGNFKGHLGGALNERPSKAPLKLAESLVEGTTIAGLRVVGTPGHGKNAITLIGEIAGKRIAFCGDLIYGDGQMWNWFDADWDYGIEGGFRAVQSSAKKLAMLRPEILCPTHGPVVNDGPDALARLAERLERVLHHEPSGGEAGAINFAEVDSPSQGWRQILPNLHQWRSGNCNVLISRETRDALLVDDGLCYWKPLPERSRHHRQVMSDLKRALNIRRFDAIIPTHYHGDHIENIPELLEMDRGNVISLDTVADVLEHPERFNLACPLPWYDAGNDTVAVHRRVKNGERIKWNEFELEFFHLGGQTYYHAGIATTIDGLRTIFVGDAMFNNSPLTEPVLTYNRCEPESQGWFYAIERLIERKPDLLVCGHGSAIRDPMPFLMRKRDAWRRRMLEYRELCPRERLVEFFDPFV
jgi:glyoxylase-like metal-dependent hydrolase (beta-lactamase superfamily II)